MNAAPANPLLDRQKRHLAELLEAVQRCIYFLDAADTGLSWPITAEMLERRKKDARLFGTLATINERFAKLQDTLGAAMRHAMGLASEPAATFLQVLSFYEKLGVVESATDWQTCRSARNLAAHGYETDYRLTAEHFNGLHAMRLPLYRTAREFLAYCRTDLDIVPSSPDFSAEFMSIVGSA